MRKGIPLSEPCYSIPNGKGKPGNRPCYSISDEMCVSASGHCEIVPSVTFKNISPVRLVHVHRCPLANPANSSDMKQIGEPSQAVLSVPHGFLAPRLYHTTWH